MAAPGGGTDLRLALREAELRPVYTIELEHRFLALKQQRPRRMHDLAIITGRANLAQAIVMRLLTPLGELAPLGHPEYGSELHRLIGQPNRERTRNLMKLHILGSLRHEPRIERVLHVTPRAHPIRRDLVEIALAVLPVADQEPLEIGPLAFDLQP